MRLPLQRLQNSDRHAPTHGQDAHATINQPFFDGLNDGCRVQRFLRSANAKTDEDGLIELFHDCLRYGSKSPDRPPQHRNQNFVNLMSEARIQMGRLLFI
jgi:hypothetical protein